MQTPFLLGPVGRTASTHARPLPPILPWPSLAQLPCPAGHTDVWVMKVLSTLPSEQTQLSDPLNPLRTATFHLKVNCFAICFCSFPIHRPLLLPSPWPSCWDDHRGFPDLCFLHTYNPNNQMWLVSTSSLPQKISFKMRARKSARLSARTPSTYPRGLVVFGEGSSGEGEAQHLSIHTSLDRSALLLPQAIEMLPRVLIALCAAKPSGMSTYHAS